MNSLIKEIKLRLEKINFSHLWLGFKPYRFALYDDKKVYLDDLVFKVDNRFLGNTAIDFEGEKIAIWQIYPKQEIDLDILTSKLIHEMFHAYQMDCQEKRYPNELIEGLNYHYSSQNLSIKYEENRLLVELIDDFSQDKFDKFLRLRKYREKKFKEALNYETKIEVIEGMAEYIELKALKILNEDLYQEAISKIKNQLLDYQKLMPIRIHSYSVGSLLLLILDNNGINFNHEIGKTTQTIYEMMVKNTKVTDIEISEKKEISALINNYYQKVNDNINSIISNHKHIIEGNFKLVGIDPLNTVKYNNYLYCKYFIAYKDKTEIKYLNQQCLAFMANNDTIKKIIY